VLATLRSFPSCSGDGQFGVQRVFWLGNILHDVVFETKLGYGFVCVYFEIARCRKYASVRHHRSTDLPDPRKVGTLVRRYPDSLRRPFP
jgi:hypothetical protein